MNKKVIICIVLFMLCLAMTQNGYCFSLRDIVAGRQGEKEATPEDATRNKEVTDINKEESSLLLKQKEEEYKDLLGLNKKLKNFVKELQKKNEKMASEMEKVKIDRENLLLQSKKLLKERDSLEGNKDSLIEVTEKKNYLEREKAHLEEQNIRLQENLKRLKAHFKSMTMETHRLGRLLDEEQMDEETKMKILEQKMVSKYEKVSAKADSLEKENRALARELDTTLKEIKRVERDNIKLEQEAKIIVGELEKVERESKAVKEENRLLAQETEEFPKKFVDIARQNKKLIEETADMHYNLGVFYVKNKEYRRAIKELEKVLEIKPEHSNAYYNIGYIYSEHLVDRPKAMQYFQNYLTYAPDARDADWVRRYILTWEAWYGKEKLK